MHYNKQTLKRMLDKQKMGHPFYFYQETDSTRFRIREYALDGEAEGALVVAEYQSAASGRQGRVWEAPAKSGIWMSLLLRPDCNPSQISVITLLAAMALSEAIEDATGLLTEIKWPNDLMRNGKKLAGILTEMECDMDTIHFVTVGIGLNVNTKQFSEELREIATSLYLETGMEFDRTAILERIMIRFAEIYEAFCAARYTFLPFRKRYMNRCAHIGKEVKIMAEEPFLATAFDITENGALLVKRKDTQEEITLLSGEVSIR